MFLGTHINGLDAKGRASAPADFRAVARADGLEGVYLWPSFDGAFLEGCAGVLMTRFRSMLDAMDPFDDAREAFAETVLGRARLLGFDATGRVSLPKEFLDHAGLESQAVFVGLGDRFRILNPALHADRLAKAEEVARENKHRLRPGAGAAA